MKEKLKNANGFMLFLYSAAFIAILFLLRCCAGFAAESFARFTGNIKTFVYSVEDFTPVAIVPTENGYISTDGDSQLIMDFAPGSVKMYGISFACKYSLQPGEILVYYTTKDNQGFSPAKRYWFSLGKKNVYTADFPMKNIKSIRIDPTTQAGNNMQISQITINPQKTFLQFFAADFGKILDLVLYSGILAAVIYLIRDVILNGTGLNFVKRNKI